MFQYPLKHTSLSSRFIIYNPFGTKTMHYGIDCVCSVGTEVYAANDGKVVFSAYDSAGGNMIIINGSQELSRYAHLSRRDVKVGDTVKRGDLIGLSGNSGRATTGAHLHFETWITPAGYSYKYSDRTKYAVDPLCVCHLLEGQTFTNNGLSTCEPIPSPEPTPEKSQLVNCTVNVKSTDIRFRVIPEVSKYQYVVGGYNRAAATFGAFFSAGKYSCTAVAENDGYTWGLITTPHGPFWVAILEGKTELEGYTPTPAPDPVGPQDESEEIKQLKMDLESCHLTIEKLQGTIETLQRTIDKIKALVAENL